jgi:preprotein translocase subunit SecG
MILAAWYHPILATLFALLAILLMGVILLQRGRGVGLAGAFGGAGGNTAFGAKTGDFLTWATIVIAGVFLVTSILLNYAFRPQTAVSRAGVLARPLSEPISGATAPAPRPEPAAAPGTGASPVEPRPVAPPAEHVPSPGMEVPAGESAPPASPDPLPEAGEP